MRKEGARCRLGMGGKAEQGAKRTSLHGSPGQRSGHALGTLDGIAGGYAQVVGSSPEPEGLGIGGVAGHGKQDFVLSGGGHSARLLVGGAGDLDMIALQRLREVTEGYGLFRLQKDHERVAVENWSLQEAHGRSYVVLPGNVGVMSNNPALDGVLIRNGFLTIAANQIKTNPGIKHFLRQFLE